MVEACARPWKRLLEVARAPKETVVPPSISCPAIELYQQLGTGILDASTEEALLDHVVACASCMGQLDTLARQDTLAELIRTSRGQDGEKVDRAMSRLIEQLSNLRPDKDRAGLAPAPNPKPAPVLPQTFACPACGKRLRVTGAAAGKTVRCPHCRQSLRLGEANAQKESRSDPGGVVSAPPMASAVVSTVDMPKSLSGQLDTSADGPGTPGVQDNKGYEFLAPPQGSDEMGRLGPYRVLRVLGAGGMGVVFLAEDPQLERRVALKAQLPAMADRPAARQRFLREARAAASLKHDHVVTIYQVGEDRGVPFLAMELLEGEPLDARLGRERKLAVAEVLRIGREAALGLAAAHEKGLVHRDVKPANVWLEAGTGRVKILDFGLARAAGGEAHLTQEGAIIGTPAYMAPEQAQGLPVDARSDVFSLGCVLYQLATGETPFRGSDVISILMAVSTQEPKSPHDVHPEFPLALSELIVRMLAKGPGERPSSAQAVAEALARIDPEANTPKDQEKGEKGSSDALPVVTEARKQPGRPLAAAKEARPKPKRSRLRAVAVVLALALLGTMAAALATVILRVETPAGTLLVELNDADVVARIKGGTLILSGPDGKVRYRLSIAESANKIDAGPYKIRVEGADGLTLNTPEFTLRNGDKVKVRVSVERQAQARKEGEKEDPSPVEPGGALEQVKVPADALRRTDIPAPVLSYVGGGDPTRAPPDLVAVLGDVRFRLNGKSHYPAFSPDGTTIAAESENEAYLFDAASGRLLRRYPGRTGEKISCLAFSPDGTMLALGERTNVRLVDVRTGDVVHDLPEHTDWVARIAFSPDGRTMVSCALDRAVRVYDVAKGRQTRVIPCPDWLFSVAVMPDGRRVVASLIDGTVRCWSLDTGKEEFVVTHGERGFGSVSVSHDGQWLAYGAIRKVSVWKIADLTKKDVTPFFEKTAPPGRPRYDPAGWACFESHSNNLWTGESGSKDGDSACCWDPAAGQRVSSVPLRIKESTSVTYALSPDDRTLAVCNFEWDRVLRLYDTRTGKPRFPDPGHIRGVYSVAFSPDGRWLASAGMETGVRVWDLSTGRQRHHLDQQSRALYPVTFSPDGKLLASGSHDGTIALWDPATGALERLLKGHEPNFSFRFSPDGKFVAEGARDGGVRMWYTRNGEEAQGLRSLHDGPVSVLAFSPDGTRLATGGQDGKVVVTDLQSGKVLASFHRKTAVSTLDFGADGETVAAGYASPESVVRVWNLKNKDFVSLDGHVDRVNMVRLRTDGRLALSSAEDGAVRLWEVGDKPGRKIILGAGSSGEKLLNAAMSQDGRYAAAGASNGLVYLFRLPSPEEDIGKWLAARGAPPRGLSEEAWLAHVRTLYPANLADAVIDRLRELNPGFDRPVRAETEGGQVTQLRLLQNVTDISPLRALPGLKRIGMNGPLTDLSPLQGMSLATLDISHTRVSDLTPLRGMNLTELGCKSTPVSDLTPLKGMKLTSLNCDFTQVGDLSPLKDMKLRRLGLRVTPVSDLTVLKGMPLENLQLDGTQVSDLTPLQGMPLTILVLVNCTQVSDLSPLKGIKLKDLRCWHMPLLTDAGLKPIEGATSLRWLEVVNTKVTEAGLEHLKDLTELETLFFSNIREPGTKLTGAGLVHLKKMTKLRGLHLENTGLPDEGLVHIEGLGGLVELFLDNAKVTDAGLEHLAKLKNLAVLRLNGTAVTDRGVAKLKAALPHCNIIR
jgi:WD40 repeat protein/serine/threonine protein kinase